MTAKINFFKCKMDRAKKLFYFDFLNMFPCLTAIKKKEKKSGNVTVSNLAMTSHVSLFIVSPGF